MMGDWVNRSLILIKNFFMIIPRPWTPIQYQRSPEQANALAKPSSTDVRNKAGGFLAFLAWCTICYSLCHSIHHYKRRNQGHRNSFLGFLKYCPWIFRLVIPLLLLKVGYAIASSFVWTISPFKFDNNAAWLYGLGTTPVILIILIFEISGFSEPNEDRALLAQRAGPGRDADAMLRTRPQKPKWWRTTLFLLRDQHRTSEEQRTHTENSGGASSITLNVQQDYLELGVLSTEQRQPRIS